MLYNSPKVNGSPGTTDGVESAEEANSKWNEFKNIIEVTAPINTVSGDREMLTAIDHIGSNMWYNVSGTADAITLNRAITNKIAEYHIDMVVFFKPTRVNTSAVTIRIGNLTPVPLITDTGSIDNGFLNPDMVYMARYTANGFVLISAVNADATGSGTGGSVVETVIGTDGDTLTPSVLTLADTSVSSVTFTLPDLALKTKVSIKDYKGTFDINSLFILPGNGEKIDLAPKGDTIEIDAKSASRDLLCIDANANTDGPHWVFV